MGMDSNSGGCWLCGRCTRPEKVKEPKLTPEELLEKLEQLDGIYTPQLQAWIHFFRCNQKNLVAELRKASAEIVNLQAEVALLRDLKEQGLDASSAERLVKLGIATWSKPNITPEELWKSIKAIQDEKDAKRAARRALLSSSPLRGRKQKPNPDETSVSPSTTSSTTV